VLPSVRFTQKHLVPKSALRTLKGDATAHRRVRIAVERESGTQDLRVVRAHPVADLRSMALR
jgi:hypothetical protein